eukprot:TRINITY_DN14331_c0_g6_i1.p1 TRINITY_DN14331_c0_g6~~TRINITY_DN14331_c0_g6_i1.p1  ORF type:complete len:233 (+),score=73.23 TRINITY_DN14331_c0_g6_i1:81-779(+)
MVKGRKVNHTRGGGGGYAAHQDDVMERNKDDLPRAPKAEESSEDEDEEEDKDKLKNEKPKKIVLERDDELEAELAAQFDDGTGLTRKQKEELERQEEERKQEKAIKDQSTDEAKETMARLEEVRRRREEAAAKRLKEQAEAEVKEKQQAEKEEGLSKQREVAEEVARLVAASKDGKMTISQLNQDAACKKVLKPLCKKHGIKALNKGWLEKFPDLLKLETNGSDCTITPKKK